MTKRQNALSFLILFCSSKEIFTTTVLNLNNLELVFSHREYGRQYNIPTAEAQFKLSPKQLAGSNTEKRFVIMAILIGWK